MKRILQITGSMDRAGAETMVMNLYRELNKEKFQFDFLYFTSKKCDFDDEIVKMGGRIYRIIEKNPFKRMRATKKLLVENPHWQTIHCHTLLSNAFHIYAAYQANVRKRISHSHNTRDASKNYLLKVIYQPISRKIQARFATDFIACGKEAGDYLFPKVKNVQILQNAIDVKTFANIASRNKEYLRNKFNFNKSTIILIQIGRFTKVKNHEFSLKIAEELIQQNIDFHLFFVGQGPLEQQIREKVRINSLEEKISFLGLREDIPRLLGGSDLLLMPSFHEGFPVVLVESQACGTPALISDNIAKEVDLNLGLINFASLSNQPKNWIKKIEKIIQKPIINTENRYDILKGKGFDDKTNVSFLENLYLRKPRD